MDLTHRPAPIGTRHPAATTPHRPVPDKPPVPCLIPRPRTPRAACAAADGHPVLAMPAAFEAFYALHRDRYWHYGLPAPPPTPCTEPSATWPSTGPTY